MKRIRLKYVARVIAGQAPPGDLVTPLENEPDGFPFIQGNAEFTDLHPKPYLSCESPPKIAPKGSILLSVRAPVGALNVADQHLGIGRGIAAIDPDSTWTVRGYFWWALHEAMPSLHARATGSTYDAVDSEAVTTLPIVVHSQETQNAIGDFLDAETARIDALVEKKRKMINLIEERWGRLVRAMVCPSRDHPFPALPVKRRWQIIDCKHRTPAYVPEGYPVVSPGDISPGILNLSACHRFVDENDFADLTEGRRPRKGDLIYSRNASIGIAAYVNTDQPFCMGQDVCLITSRDQDQRFLGYVLNTLGLDQLEQAKVGSTFSRVNIAQIAELRIPTPEPDQQVHIADALDRRRERVKDLVALLERQIDLLAEHRRALITAAVTGQLELAEAA